MADNIVKAKNGERVLSKIFKALTLSSNGSKAGLAAARKRAWWSAGAPTVDAASQETYPVQLGDLAYDVTNSQGHICTVVPTASTAATFVKLHA